MFDPTPASIGASPAHRHDPDLLGDVDSFVAAITNETYSEGYGDYGDYGRFGDESWTVRMDELFGRTGAAFLGGDVTLARRAYRLLLEAIGEGDTESGFPGEGPPRT